MTRKVGLAGLGPFASTSDDSDGFFAVNEFKDFAHIIIRFCERNGIVFNDGVGEDCAITTLNDDFFSNFSIRKVFKNANDVWSAVVTINDDGATRTWFGGLVIPASLENVIRCVECASTSEADGDDLAIPDVTEARDGDIARVGSRDSIIGDFFFGRFGFVNFLRFNFGADNISSAG